jgi:hypothetical protein
MAKLQVPRAALEAVREAAGRIRQLEATALAALHGSGDTAAHRSGLAEKCVQLTSLPEEVEALLPDPATPGSTALVQGLEDFASRAGMALSLESIFFMGALLYPDDYQDGEPNDLERFLTRFEPI